MTKKWCNNHASNNAAIHDLILTEKVLIAIRRKEKGPKRLMEGLAHETRLKSGKRGFKPYNMVQKWLWRGIM